ncbi:MAG: bifunctional oligoribonuclease/PAP phosphatase NrnA [Erysipelotrichaceae bacterium]|nr:bifunctional oligoribonuclease/PAP phosphatase NrnA [Erysipelotrichaceae bacterium]
MKLKKLIEEAKQISLFAHARPDGDALGSQFGLAGYLRSRYPDKPVFICGSDGLRYGDFFPLKTPVSSEDIRASLAIVLDTPSVKRVEDQRFLSASKIVRIDHHPGGEDFAILDIEDVTASSTSELVAGILYKWDSTPLDKEIAAYFYFGLLFDTLCLSIPSVSEKTMAIAAWLAKSGMSVSDVNQAYTQVPLSLFEAVSALRSKLVYDQRGLGYVVLTNDFYQSYGVDIQAIKEQVHVLGEIRELKFWALFLQDENNPQEYSGSLRARKTPIRALAQKYGGGGHELACGISHLTLKRLNELIEELALLAAQSE